VSGLPDGVYTVVPTPFDAEGSLDLASLERLVGFLVDRGIAGLLVLGVLGEAPKLLADERRAVVETAIAAAAGKPVIVGVTHASTAGTTALAQAAEQAGAAAVLVAPPRLERAAGQQVLVDYFTEVATSTSLELVLQDHPASSGVELPPLLIAQLAEEVPQLTTVKLEDPPTPLKLGRLRAACPSLKLYGGLGGVYLLEELGRGANGTMTGFAFPELLVQIHAAHASGDLEGAEQAFFAALPLIRFEFQEAVGLALRKRIYRLRGAIESDHVREPTTALDAASEQELERLLRHVAKTPTGTAVGIQWRPTVSS